MLLGHAHKKNASDIRESPSIALPGLLKRRGTHVDSHDRRVQEILSNREQMKLERRKTVGLDAMTIARYNAVLAVTDDDEMDYYLAAQPVRLITDTRNAIGKRCLGVG